MYISISFCWLSYHISIQAQWGAKCAKIQWCICLNVYLILYICPGVVQLTSIHVLYVKKCSHSLIKGICHAHSEPLLLCETIINIVNLPPSIVNLPPSIWTRFTYLCKVSYRYRYLDKYTTVFFFLSFRVYHYSSGYRGPGIAKG